MPNWGKASIVFFILGILIIGWSLPQARPAQAQQPTGSIPTVTGTAAGPFVTVYADLKQVDVYAGPSSYLYPSVGILLAGQSAPALGRTTDQDWIQVHYPGVPGSTAWVYAPYVRISPGARLPVVKVPPTPTPFSTPTIDPTLAAAFIAPETPTRLPTFTPPAKLETPVFIDEAAGRFTRFPIGLMIFLLGFIGGMGMLLSYLRGR
ncbi:MAG: hypothetical protein Fur0043_07530 [Anaerolineales bacterium]